MDQQVNKYKSIIYLLFVFFFFQLSFIPIAINSQTLIQHLISHHKNVCKEIGFLSEQDHQPLNLTKPLTRAIEALVCTLFLSHSRT